MSGNRGNRLRFSKQDDEKLINAVSNNPALYDLKHKFYHDHPLRDITWEEIAKDVGKTVADCKIRWKSLKDVYRKRKREMEENTSKKLSKWEHMDSLSFLEGVASTRSVAATQKTTTTDEVDRPDLVFVESLTDDKVDDTEIKIEIDEPDLESEASLETIMKEEPIIPETTPKEEPMQQQSEGRHPVQVFFDSMAHTVMGLPPPFAVRAKMEVLQAVSKLELEVWEEQAAGSSQNQSHKFS